MNVLFDKSLADYPLDVPESTLKSAA